MKKHLTKGFITQTLIPLLTAIVTLLSGFQLKLKVVDQENNEALAHVTDIVLQVAKECTNEKH